MIIDFTGFETPEPLATSGIQGVGAAAGAFDALFGSRVAYVNNDGYLFRNIGGAALTGQFKFAFDSLPVADVDELLKVTGTYDGDPWTCYVGFEVATGKLRTKVSHHGTNTGWADMEMPPLTPDTVYRLDYLMDLSADFNTDFALNGQVSEVGWGGVSIGGAVGLTQIRITMPTAAFYTLAVDDFFLSGDSADFPLPDLTTTWFPPTADGAHNNGSGQVRDAFGLAINGTTRTAWDKLAAKQEPNGYLRFMVADGASYAEVLFEDDLPADRDPVAIKATAGIQNSANASANDLKVKAYIPFDPPLEYVLFSGTTFLFPSGANPIVYGRALFQSPDYAMTREAVEGMSVRIGFSTDINPEPSMDFVWFEVAHMATPPHVSGGGGRGSAGRSVATPVHAFINRGRGWNP